MKIRPRQDYVVIKRDEPKDASKGGIALVLARDAAEAPEEGVVVDVGPGKHVKGRLVRPELKVGNRVLIGAYAGQTVKVGDENFVMMRESEVLGVLG